MERKRQGIKRRLQELRIRRLFRKQAAGHSSQQKNTSANPVPLANEPTYPHKRQEILKKERHRRLEEMKRRKAQKLEMELLTAQTSRLLNPAGSVSSLLETLQNFDFSTATTSSVSEIVAHEMEGFTNLDGVGRLLLGTLNGTSCYLSVEPLSLEALHDKTSPTKRTPIHPLFREVEFYDENSDPDPALKFRGIRLGRLIMDGSEASWVVFLSERKDIWILRAKAMESNKFLGEFGEESDDPMQAVEHTSPEKLGVIPKVLDAAAVKLGTLEQMILSQQQGLGLIDPASVTAEEGVYDWCSVLIPTGHLDQA